MDSTTLTRINLTRMMDWEKKLNSDHATPMVMIACGHDEKAGTVHIMVPDGISHSQAIALLAGAIAGLQAGKLKLN